MCRRLSKVCGRTRWNKEKGKQRIDKNGCLLFACKDVNQQQILIFHLIASINISFLLEKFKNVNYQDNHRNSHVCGQTLSSNALFW